MLLNLNIIKGVAVLIVMVNFLLPVFQKGIGFNRDPNESKSASGSELSSKGVSFKSTVLLSFFLDLFLGFSLTSSFTVSMVGSYRTYMEVFINEHKNFT